MPPGLGGRRVGKLTVGFPGTAVAQVVVTVAMVTVVAVMTGMAVMTVAVVGEGFVSCRRGS